MRRVVLNIMCAFLAVLLICGCGKEKSTSKSTDKVEIEVAIFQGGWGLDFFQRAAREYEKLHPNVKIRLWGNPRIWEQLRTRFVAGDVPDLCWPGWGMDTWALVYEGKVMEMDRFLDEKAYGQDKKWKDTFIPHLLEKGRYKGHYYI
ncbi:MAG: extracellular solute-binding protein, partial [Armatimonadetes bacterium]|nr:extracellular solute-binding protein [Armatimonadota bacterium]